MSVQNPNIAVDVASGVNDVTIDGFTVKGSPTSHYADEAAIRFGGSSGSNTNIAVQDNIINGYTGVLDRGGNNFTTSDNRITANKTGIVIQQGPASNVTISGNVITPGTSLASDPTGIYMTSVNGGDVSDNTANGFVNGTGRGFQASHIQNVTISGNTFSDAQDGISIFGSGTDSLTISGNTLANDSRYGINVKGTNVVISSGNDFQNNGTAAVSIGDTGINSSVSLSGNTYSTTTVGIQLVAPGASLSNVANISETISNATTAVSILGGTANVTQSTFTSNATAISIAGGAANVTNSLISGNTVGIDVSSATAAAQSHFNQNSITGNTSAITNSTGTPIDASTNWWGSNIESAFASMFPVSSVDFTPYLDNGSNSREHRIPRRPFDPGRDHCRSPDRQRRPHPGSHRPGDQRRHGQRASGDLQRRLDRHQQER